MQVKLRTFDLKWLTIPILPVLLEIATCLFLNLQSTCFQLFIPISSKATQTAVFEQGISSRMFFSASNPCCRVLMVTGSMFLRQKLRTFCKPLPTPQITRSCLEQKNGVNFKSNGIENKPRYTFVTEFLFWY